MGFNFVLDRFIDILIIASIPNKGGLETVPIKLLLVFVIMLWCVQFLFIIAVLFYRPDKMLDTQLFLLIVYCISWRVDLYCRRHLQKGVSTLLDLNLILLYFLSIWLSSVSINIYPNLQCPWDLVELINTEKLTYENSSKSSASTVKEGSWEYLSG